MAALAALLAMSAIVLTWHWPMVGDSRFIRYGSFLISRGYVPYRDFAEINLPGCFAIDWAVIHTFGAGPLAWRIFDLLLTASSGLAMLFTIGLREWRSGVIAASLFAMAHWSDGIAQSGQRDLQIAVLLLAGIAAWVALAASRPALAAFVFGLLHGSAFISKPNSLLLTFGCLLVIFITRRAAGQSGLPVLGFAGVGFVIPCAAIVVYLTSNGALSQFWFTLRVLLPYHAGLARRSLSYLLVHSIAPYALLVYLWLIGSFDKHRSRLTQTSLLLLAGSLGGLAMYLTQGKGFPYHRYPFLMFLLPLIATDCAQWLHSGEKIRRVTASVAFAGAVLVVCSISLHRISRFDPYDPFGTSLTRDLAALPALDHRVQCLDSVQGCIAALASLRVVQSTGLIYDEFLFGDERSLAVQDSRAGFTRKLEAQPPLVIVLVDRFFPESTPGYQAVATWPEFSAWLDEHYRLAVDRPSPGTLRWWSRPEPAPGYRLYVLHESTVVAKPAPH